VSFIYQRTVRFQDTDAAGVVYFANVLAICHEAYEASLTASGIDLNRFFRGADVAIPIVHASVDFMRPMMCGDRLQIHLTPMQLSSSEFEIAYRVFLSDRADKPASQAITRHVSIQTATRKRQDLSSQLLSWVAQWQDATATQLTD
jgi:1,4-dihydroxy-2-naphthoyl-CoA hydrolase